MSPDPRVQPLTVLNRRELEDLERLAPPLRLPWWVWAIGAACAGSSLTWLALACAGRLVT